MTIIRRTTPLGELISLRNTMDRLVDDTGRPRSGWLSAKPRQIQISPVSEAQAELEAQARPETQPAAEPGTEQGT